MVAEGLTCAIEAATWATPPRKSPARYGVARDEQDAFAAESQRRAVAAIEAGCSRDEIVAGRCPAEEGRSDRRSTRDEYPRAGTTVEKLAALKPAFKKDGTVTAGNASGINDGAAALVVTSDEHAPREVGTRRSRASSRTRSTGVDPKFMGMGPVPAVSEGARSRRTDDRRHRSLRAQRSVRGAVDRRRARSAARSGAGERERRRDRARTSDRRQRRPRADTLLYASSARTERWASRRSASAAAWASRWWSNASEGRSPVPDASPRRADWGAAKPLSSLDDGAVVAAALKGRPEACEEIVRRYERPIYGLIARMVRDEAQAEDLTQDTFLKLFRALARYDPTMRFSSWLFRIAHNTAIDYLRQRRLLIATPVDDPDDESDPAAGAAGPLRHQPGAIGRALRAGGRRGSGIGLRSPRLPCGPRLALSGRPRISGHRGRPWRATGHGQDVPPQGQARPGPRADRRWLGAETRPLGRP